MPLELSTKKSVKGWKKKEKERRTRWNEIGIRETRITVLK